MLYQAFLNKFTDGIERLHAACIDTPLGSMIAIGDDSALYLLDFVDRQGLEQKIERMLIKTNSGIIAGASAPLVSIENELTRYFNGHLNDFKTPLQLFGSPFQKSVWGELLRTPHGKTRSYLEQASAIGKPTATRAVANANGANQIAIVIPCHRIINTNGDLGGYGGGVHRKAWLIKHEKHKGLRP